MNNAQIDAFNAGQQIAAIEAKRELMFGSEGFTPDMLRHFTAVAKVATDDLEEAFELTNLWNDESKVTRLERMSSTSVGDIFSKDGRYFMVDSFGFEELRLFEDELEVL